MYIFKRKVLIFVFSLSSTIFAYGYSSDVSQFETNDCLVLKFDSQAQEKVVDSLYTNFGFHYYLMDTCRNEVLDTIISSSGIATTKNDLYYSINCTDKRCVLYLLDFFKGHIEYNPIFKWSVPGGIPPELYLPDMSFQPKDSIFTFRSITHFGRQETYGFTVTKIKDSCSLDTLSFIPHIESVNFSNDGSQLIMRKHVVDPVEKDGILDLAIYDLFLDTFYMPLTNNKQSVFFPERISRNSYMYYMKLNLDKGYDLYRKIESKPEERLTFLGDQYFLNTFKLINDTLLIYEVSGKVGSVNVLEQRLLSLEK